MNIDYKEKSKIKFSEELNSELEKMISGEIKSVEIKNIPSSVFCEIT